MTDLTKVLLLLQLASTLAMTGLVWFVQVGHYPLFAAVGPDRFAAYEAQHRSRTTWVVAPLMLTEAMTTILLFRAVPELLSLSAAVGGAALLLVIWLSTAFWQVPLHETLSRGFDDLAWNRLVRSNWLRTSAWTGRSMLLLGVLWHWLW